MNRKLYYEHIAVVTVTKLERHETTMATATGTPKTQWVGCLNES